MRDFTHVTVKELPYEIQKVVNGLYKGRTIKAHPCVDFKCPTNWHDANVMKLTAYNASTGELKTITSGCYDNYMNFTPEEKAMYHGKLQSTLPPNIWMILTESYPKSCSIFTHPDNISKLIASNESDLSELEKKVLFITRSLISSARLDEARRLGIPKPVWLELQAGLIQKGYLMKNGALTIKGKNVAKDIPYYC